MFGQRRSFTSRGYGPAGGERSPSRARVTHCRGGLRHHLGVRRLALWIGLSCLLVPAAAQADWRAVPDPSARPDVPAVTIRQDVDAKTVLLRTWYDTWNGRRRAMTILFPRAAENTGRVLPLLVAAHPAGGASTCVDQIASLAGRFDFVLACLDGQGISTRAFSYGAPGQIADLAAAPNGHCWSPLCDAECYPTEDKVPRCERPVRVPGGCTHGSPLVRSANCQCPV